jgi:hypothetical protein
MFQTLQLTPRKSFQQARHWCEKGLKKAFLIVK